MAVRDITPRQEEQVLQSEWTQGEVYAFSEISEKEAARPIPERLLRAFQRAAALLTQKA